MFESCRAHFAPKGASRASEGQVAREAPLLATAARCCRLELMGFGKPVEVFAVSAAAPARA